MNLDLNEKELAVLQQLSKEKDISEEKIMKMALAFYQIEHEKVMGRWQPLPSKKNTHPDYCICSICSPNELINSWYYMG